MSESGDPPAATRFQTGFRRALWIVFAACLVAGVILAWEQRSTRKREDRDAARSARELAAKSAATIDGTFRAARGVADAIVRDLASGALPYTDIEARMRRECEARDDIAGIAVAFEPFAYDPGLRLYQEYLSRDLEGALSIQKGTRYDYTLPPSDAPDRPKTAWYRGPLTRGP